ncbi:hypothetical protein KFE25_006562 [Diacronema lutheri]|uniref:SRP9 domain-containing protein n=1 Tax=Diacronema lutheri TaxID=2081491 RepID=A0A8J5XE25_DIALT|nr:hypothetical protein KFE25_006562 [Diacronema lutheri]|mmetsp:Transcript_1809/g.5897  ORF Transcript_1809/g.5897 Transcript_1809/m.5897 type:complete len:103 (-) Transcript_1809:166-474(-)
MVVLSNFEQFAEEADKLYSSAPAYTRYTFKYRHCDGKLVLKVTNDIITLTYATDQAADLRKLEKFNAVLCARMCGTTPLPPESEGGPSHEPSKPRSGKSKKR